MVAINCKLLRLSSVETWTVADKIVNSVSGGELSKIMWRVVCASNKVVVYYSQNQGVNFFSVLNRSYDD